MPAMVDPSKWTYAEPGDPDRGDVDVVREWVGDTDPDVRFLGDLEVQALVDEWMPKYDSLIYVASVAAERISAKLTSVTDVSADGASVGLSSLAERYTLLAAKLRTLHDEAQVGGEVDMSNLMWDAQLDAGIKPLHFGVGFHDNPNAGQQDYGGQGYNGWDRDWTYSS